MAFALTQAVGYAAEIAPALFTAPKLEMLIMKAGLSRFQPPPRSGVQRYGKDELVASTIHGAVMAASRGDGDAADGLKEFVRLVVSRSTGKELGALAEALRAAGYDLRLVDGAVRLLPLDEPASPLSVAIVRVQLE
jgi:hypothetical protein